MARSNLNWEPSKNTLAAQKYWTEHGYTFKLYRRFISKDYYTVSKDGFDFNFQVYSSPGCPVDGQMRDFERMRETAYKLHTLQAQAGK